MLWHVKALTLKFNGHLQLKQSISLLLALEWCRWLLQRIMDLSRRLVWLKWSSYTWTELHTQIVKPMLNYMPDKLNDAVCTCSMIIKYSMSSWSLDTIIWTGCNINCMLPKLNINVVTMHPILLLVLICTQYKVSSVMLIYKNTVDSIQHYGLYCDLVHAST